MSQIEEENFVTRLNYSERAKGILGFGFFYISSLFVRGFDQGNASTPTPEIMLGRTTDIFAGGIQASVGKVLLGSRRIWFNSMSGFTINSISEIFQKLGIEQGTYDPGDFVAFSVGALAWGAFDGAARLLYNSGATKPIYRCLKIRDRRVNTYVSNLNATDNELDKFEAQLASFGQKISASFFLR